MKCTRLREVLRHASVMLLGVTATLALAGEAADYQLDLEGAQHLMTTTPGLPNPTRVEVVRFGPGRGPDSEKIWLARKSKPDYSTTNQTEIMGLMSALRAGDNRFRIENMSLHRGYTHLLRLFQETNRTVVEARIFEPIEYKTNSCAILPRDGVGSVYYSPKLGPWLHSHTRASTNTVPVLSGTSTNLPTQ
jgi:hypothetical protein